MKASHPPNWAQHLIVMSIAVLVCSLYFDGLMWSPHTRAPTFGGDGLTIHYNLQYHARYGDGAWLESQYHPHRESIFMTDAQALVAVALAELRPWFPNLHHYASGISNILIFWSNPLAIWLLFLVLRRLGVRWGIALLGGLLIGLMSPQILRQLGGQYTLGFTFLLPLLILYQLSYNDGKWYWLKSLGVAIVVILIGLNNPYMYAVSAGLLMGCAGVGILLRWFKSTRLPWPQLLSWIAVTLVATVAILSILGRYDVETDRVEVPFGFFSNIATWGGLLRDQFLSTSSLVGNLIPGLKPKFGEDQLYLGLVPILFTLALPFLLLNKRIRASLNTAVPTPLRVLLVGIIPGLVLAFAMPFAYFEDWTYEYLGSILQFRAPVRFGWPTYYLLGLLAVVGANWFYNRYQGTRAVYFLALPLVLWSLETHQFLVGHLEGHNTHNALNLEAMAKQSALADRLSIDTTQYSSVLLLPTENGWSDKIHQDGSWRSNYDGYKMSIASGLPLLNGKLSRLSLNWVLQSLQIVSHPLIEKPLLDQIDNDKDILLLVSQENDLAPEELSVLALADTLDITEKLLLARLNPAKLRARTTLAHYDAITDTSAQAPLLRFKLEEDTTHAYVGKGSRLILPKWTDVLEFPADSLELDINYELTAWAYADGSRFGGPKFFVRQFDADGKKRMENQHWINRAYDAHRHWLRTRVGFRLHPQATRIVLVSEYAFPFWLDEVWVGDRDKTYKVNHDGDMMFDGVRLDE